ncbi:CPBP family intramembrane glutamic endopeptidase [Streptomyces hainanensis]|nr:CPBP family intramembrane glutamic endopeptidase [Streptomyces hainanensis]
MVTVECCLAVSGWPRDTPTTAGEGKLLTIGLLLWFARELLLRHGVAPSVTGLGFGPATVERHTVAGVLAGGVTLIALILTCTQIRIFLFEHFPVYGPGLSGPGNLFEEVARYAWTSVVEELLLTAVVVTLLVAARRPAWEWLLVAAVLRFLPHLYLGLSGMDTLLLGAGAAWIFYRYRDVLPLIVAHFLYNTVILDFTAQLPQRWAAVVLAWVAAGVVTVVAVVSPGSAPSPRRHPAKPTPRH